MTVLAPSTDNIFGDSPIIWAILAVEISFWVLLVLGLAVRYLLRRPRLSAALLVGVPLLDLVLIVLTAVDLAGGAAPNFSHGLATLYLGFTVGFGHATITAVDRWFAVRFGGAPRPAPATSTGPVYVRAAWREWRRVATMWAVSAALLVLMKTLAGGWPELSGDDPVRALLDSVDPMVGMIRTLSMVTAAWLVFGPVYAMFFRAAEPVGADPAENNATPARR